MPQRQLRPQIRQSKRWNRLPYFEQSLYVRLLTMVDDFARYEADAELLKSEAFPYGDPEGKPVQMTAVDSGLLSLASNDLLFLYEFEGNKYLQLTRWKERTRAQVSRFPDPKDPKCRHLTANDSKCPPPRITSPSPSSDTSTSPTAANGAGDANVILEKYKTVESKVNEWYKRGPNDRWAYDEQFALAAVLKRAECLKELAEIGYWRDHMQERKRFFPQTVSKLLNGWTEALDKARVQCPMPKPAINREVTTKPKGTPLPIEKRRELFSKARQEAKV